MLEELPEQDRHHPLEPQIPQVLDMPAIGSARGAGMAMLAQNSTDGITSINVPSNTTLNLDSGIEQESNPGGDASRLRDISTESNSSEGQDRHSEKSAMDNVEEDVTREKLTQMDVDSDSGALIAGPLVSHVPTIATSRWKLILMFRRAHARKMMTRACRKVLCYPRKLLLKLKRHRGRHYQLEVLAQHRLLMVIRMLTRSIRNLNMPRALQFPS